MEFNHEVLNNIDTAIDIHLAKRVERDVDLFGFPVRQTGLCYTLNSQEIAYGEKQLNKTGSKICVVKRKVKYNAPSVIICYYRHTLGKFIVALDYNDQVISIC